MSHSGIARALATDGHNPLGPNWNWRNQNDE